jgi:hypothetical protein
VGGIVTRIQAEIDASVDHLEGLRHFSIDEISYKRGHRYLTIVVDHDTGRLVWAGGDRDKATLDKFFVLLGAERRAQITHVPADAAGRIATRWPNMPPELSAAPIRSLWSRGPPTHSTSCVARPGRSPRGDQPTQGRPDNGRR